MDAWSHANCCTISVYRVRRGRSLWGPIISIIASQFTGPHQNRHPLRFLMRMNGQPSCSGLNHGLHSAALPGGKPVWKLRSASAAVVSKPASTSTRPEGNSRGAIREIRGPAYAQWLSYRVADLSRERSTMRSNQLPQAFRMRYLYLFILTCVMAVGTSLVGCAQQEEVAKESPPASFEGEPTAQTASEVSAPGPQQNEVLVFRGKYYKTTGPCIQLGNTLAMPIIDAFEVVEVLAGNLKAKSIDVRAMSGGGSSYPQDLAEGKVYTLRLTPSAGTSKQLRKNENKEGLTFLWVDGDEIEEQKTK